MRGMPARSRLVGCVRGWGSGPRRGWADGWVGEHPGERRGPVPLLSYSLLLLLLLREGRHRGHRGGHPGVGSFAVLLVFAAQAGFGLVIVVLIPAIFCVVLPPLLGTNCVQTSDKRCTLWFHFVRILPTHCS